MNLNALALEVLTDVRAAIELPATLQALTANSVGVKINAGSVFLGATYYPQEKTLKLTRCTRYGYATGSTEATIERTTDLTQYRRRVALAVALLLAN